MRNKFNLCLSAFLFVILISFQIPDLLYAQWVKQNAPVQGLLSDVFFINSNTGWACTITSSGNDTSFILKTTNGGTNWFRQYFGIGHAYRTIYVVDINTVFCGGEILPSHLPLLMKTTDGGFNWINKAPPSCVYDIYFANEDSGWYSAPNSTPQMRTTTDGGTTWQVRSSGITSSLFIISFLNYQTGFVSGYCYVFKTTNAGMNWTPTGTFYSTISSMFFLNQNYGWAGLASGKVAHTNNGGFDWILQSTPAEGSPYGVTDLYFFNNMYGYAGSVSPKVLKTFNGGVTWGYQIDSGYAERLNFIDSLTGWTVYNSISKTTNGGGSIIYVGFNQTSVSSASSFKLYQNYPNPFNPSTTIKVDIAKASETSLYIYDMLGRVVYKIENQYLNAGSHEFVWNADELCSGVYMAKIIAGNFSDSKKMILVR